MNTKSEQAVSRFKEGFSCSQAVLSVFAEQFGLVCETALRISAGFGGGMGRMAQTCGTVTAAFMVIGLKYDSQDPKDKQTKERTYHLVRQFAEKFKARNGSVTCSHLLGCDISTPQGAKTAQEKNLFSTVCPKMVQEAVEILDEIITQ
jgi:C_GCAxxG_C_C family probable redox protein